MNDDIACTIKTLDEPLRIPAAASAIAINPANAPAMLTDGTILTPDRLAVITAKKWPASGVKLTVGFMDSAPDNLQARILQHFNAWGKFCNVSFVLTNTDPQVRIARENDGYWSYLGTDILHIPKNRQTMNLQGFTMNTAESEFVRVVRHEVGHTLGFPHEHMRAELVARLDVAKTISWGRQVLGWDEQTVRQQILTPLNEASIRGTPHADQESIMAYQLPGSITKDGRPILGGADIDTLDGQFAGSLYPLALEPVDPVKPPPGPGGVCPTICDILLQLQVGVGRMRRSYLRGDDMKMSQTEIDQVQAATGACANLQWSKIIANILGGACPPPAAPAGGTCQALAAQVLGMFCKP